MYFEKEAFGNPSECLFHRSVHDAGEPLFDVVVHLELAHKVVALGGVALDIAAVSEALSTSVCLRWGKTFL